MLILKLDESYNKEKTAFVVGGFLAEESEWKQIAADIEASIQFENDQLPCDKRIERYHASEMNSRLGDYETWDSDEGGERIVRMTKKLIDSVCCNVKASVSVGLDLASHQELFPEKRPSDPYILCFQFALNALANHLNDIGLNDPVSVVLAAGDHDVDALTAYKLLADDPSYIHHGRFVAVDLHKWRDDVGLQAADAMAYETMRELRPLLSAISHKMRKPLDSLLQTRPDFFAKHFDREVLQQLKADSNTHNAQ